MSFVRRLPRLLAATLALCAMPALAQSTRVSNTATLSYAQGGTTATIRSNTVTLDVATVTKRPTSLSFRLLPLGYELKGFSCQTDPTLIAHPAEIDAATLAAAPKIDTLDIEQPSIMVLDNPGGNRDPTVRETSYIEVDTGQKQQRIALVETAPDSGVFAGGSPAQHPDQSMQPDPCFVQLHRGDKLTLRFAEDPYSYGSTNSILIDPAGLVFDSHTAALVDGATVSLVGLDGLPADVFGDDGVSTYPSTVVTGQPVTDASGRVYPATTGGYHFPLTRPGTYVLKVVPPAGYTAPSTVDRGTLATLKSPTAEPYILNAASFGGSLTLATSDPFYADIPIDPIGAGSLIVTKVASVRQASPGDFIQYRITVANRGQGQAAGLHVADTLPVGLRYERGSARGAAEPVAAADARSLDFALPPLAAGASAELSYVVTVAPGAPIGEALNRARVVGPGATSNEAAASVRLQALLFSDAMTVIGRVTEGDCGQPASRRHGVPGIRLLLEDGTFVVTDRDGLYHFEGVRAGRHVVQIDTGSVPASHEPVACDIDTRQGGSAISRFVEGYGGLLKRVDFQLRRTGQAAATIDALPIAVAADADAAGNRDWLTGQAPGIAWLFPGPDHNPRAPALRVVIKHAPSQRVALTVGGTPVGPLNFDATDTDAATGVAVSRWTGIPLAAGDNRLVARVLNADGSVAQTLERSVHYAGAAVVATYDAANSRLVADGLTRPLIAVHVTDATGHPVRSGTLVPFRVDQPYVAALEAELEQGRQLAGRERMQTVAKVVGDDGLAFIALQPTTQAGAVHAVVTLAEEKQVRTSEIRAWLSAAAKDWVVVGFGAGSLGYDTLRTRSSVLPQGVDRGVVTDGQLALYAKGRIKGSWLLTLAYDSDRKYDPDRGLLGVIDPDRYYTVYGDGSQQAYDAPTRRKLYLRLERRAFYALFGDFETGLTETQLTRYDRTLNGVKAAYEGTRVRATGFAAKTDQLYARDEFQGNGLSGPYRLSTSAIVPNSDKIRIEVRDRFRSELIVSSREMTRHIDYDIDTDLGTIRFREPVLGRDANLNPTFIVVDYEVEGGHGEKLAAAARVAASLAQGRVVVGVAAIRDETIGTATILGADVKAQLNRTTVLRGEVATGGRYGLGQGLAYLAEAEHHGPRLDLLAYVRDQGAAFGVDQQNFVEAGTRKFGLDGRYKLTDRLSLTATVWHQSQLDTPGERTAGDVRLEWRRDTGTVFVGAQFANDQGIDGKNRDSRLLTLGGSESLLDGKLTVVGQTQFAPGGDRDSVDFPARQQITLAYRVTPGIRLIGGYEIAEGQDFTARTAQVGFDLAPWTGAKLLTTLNQQAVGENGQRTFAEYGLHQSLPLGKRWTLDATLDASSTVRGTIPLGAVVSPFQPVASGGYLGQEQTNGDYTAATFGATYRAQRWSWNGRLEYRMSSVNDRFGITTNALRTLGEGETIAARLQLYRVETNAGAVATYASGDVALALRPLDSRWSLLERFELRHEQAGAGITDANALGVPAYDSSGDQVTSRAVNNLALNYRTGPEGLGHGTEISFYYGAKYVRGRFADDVYDGYIDVTGFELRQDIGTHFDFGVAGSAQHAWSRDVWAYSGGPSVGVSPATNVWISAGYNVAGYRDADFEADRYTRQGPYVTMRLKFDQRSIGGAARALLGGR